MHAPLSVSKNQSRISINFGQKITSQNNPIELNLQVDFFSQKNQNIRFNLEQMFDIKIEDATFVLEIIAKNGSGTQLVDKLNNFKKTKQTYQNVTNSDEQELIKIMAKGEICYVIVHEKKSQKDFLKVHQFFINLKQQHPGIEKINSPIKLQIKSLNNCDYIRKLLDNQGIPRAFNDSLNVELKFQKTKLVDSVLNKFFEENEIQPLLVSPLKACKKLNLNLNFASSSEQDRYQQLRVCLKKVEQQKFKILKQIKGQYKDEVYFLKNIQVKFYFFDPFVSFSGKCHAQNVASLLETFFE